MQKSSRALAGHRFSFFAAVLFLIAAISGFPAHAQTMTVTVPVGGLPDAIAVNPVTNKIYVANLAGNSVTVIDGATNIPTTVITGNGPDAVAVNTVTNTIYVANQTSDTVTVINGATNATSTVAVGASPGGIAVNSVTNTIYVANETSNNVTVMSGATNTVTGTVTVGSQPIAIAVNTATNTVYAANYTGSSVTVINGATNATATVATGSFPAGIAVNMVTNTIYVANQNDAGTVTVINGATNATATVTAGINTKAIAVNPVTNTVYVANPGGFIGGTVTVINGVTNATATVTPGAEPGAIAVNSVTNTAYVANFEDGTVTVINGATNAVTGTVTVGAPTTQGSVLAVNTATNTVYVANGGDASVTVIAPLAAPTLTTFPQNQSVNAGQSVTFTAAASGSPTYQWSFNGAAISGATNASLTLTNVTSASAGTYAVVATNGGGSVGANATLTVAALSQPVFTIQPVSQTVVSGTTVVFNSAASGSPAPTFQWKLNGVAISGATSARLVIAGATAAANAGTYTCVATNSQGPATSSTATLGFVTTTNVGRLVNLSVNTTAGKSQVLTVGFVTGGAGTTGSQTLLLRATGPALAALGVQNVLADPTLTVFSGQTVVTSNDNWGTPASNQAAITTADNATGAFALTNPASLDAALVDALTAGGYTVQVSGNTAPSGTTLAEVYDYTPANTYTLATPRLINISSNNQIAANGSMTAGFVIGGSTSKTVLIRATGPALAVLGVQGTMPDPQLALHTTINNQDTVLASNAGWGGDPQIATVSAAVGAFPLTSATSKDSVVLITLPPGSYTAVASSVTGTAGVALIEVYEVP